MQNNSPNRQAPVPPRRQAQPVQTRRPVAAEAQDRHSAAPREPGGPRTPKQRPRIKSRWFTAIIMVLITLGSCFFLAMFILQSASDLFGLNQEDKQIEIMIPQDSTLASISVLLHNKGVISQPFTFRLYAGLKIEDEANEIKQGTYIFNSDDAYDQIINALKKGNTQKEEVRITFIEGENLYQMAKKLEEKKVCSADEFLDYMNKGDFDYEFMNQVPNDVLRYRRLEGYAFPDTYDFYVGMGVPQVADRFLENFDKRITDDMRAKMREKNLSIDETLILASIIQKEAGDPVEMTMVSSVFQNRLGRPEQYPNLQSDVTIHYVDNFIKPFLDRQDQPMYDAYNTYKCTGLPVGAVCNPGLAAINAVLDPDESDYLFFVTDDEGTYYYSQTAQQHYANIAKAAQVGGDKVHGTATVNE